MELSSYRYLGRFVGLGDALAMRWSNLSHEEYYALPPEEMKFLIAEAIASTKAGQTAAKLLELSKGATMANASSLIQLQDIRIGLREAMLLVKNNEDISKLILPNNYLHQFN